MPLCVSISMLSNIVTLDHCTCVRMSQLSCQLPASAGLPGRILTSEWGVIVASTRIRKAEGLDTRGPADVRIVRRGLMRVMRWYFALSPGWLMQTLAIISFSPCRHEQWAARDPARVQTWDLISLWVAGTVTGAQSWEQTKTRVRLSGGVRSELWSGQDCQPIRGQGVTLWPIRGLNLAPICDDCVRPVIITSTFLDML